MYPKIIEMTAVPPPPKKTFSGDVFDADAVAVFVAYKVPIITNAVTPPSPITNERSLT